MADYGELWCTSIDNLTEEEFKWFAGVTGQIAIAVSDEDPAQFPSFLSDNKIDVSEIDCAPDFRLHTDESGERSATFTSEGDSGERLDVHAAIIQEFFRCFRPKAAHVIHWSAACSRMKVDAFGGGCAVITSQETHFMTTWGWSDSKLEELGFKKGD